MIIASHCVTTTGERTIPKTWPWSWVSESTMPRVMNAAAASQEQGSRSRPFLWPGPQICFQKRGTRAHQKDETDDSNFAARSDTAGGAESTENFIRADIRLRWRFDQELLTFHCSNWEWKTILSRKKIDETTACLSCNRYSSEKRHLVRWA